MYHEILETYYPKNVYFYLLKLFIINQNSHLTRCPIFLFDKSSNPTPNE